MLRVSTSLVICNCILFENLGSPLTRMEKTVHDDERNEYSCSHNTSPPTPLPHSPFRSGYPSPDRFCRWLADCTRLFRLGSGLALIFFSLKADSVPATQVVIHVIREAVWVYKAAIFCLDF